MSVTIDEIAAHLRCEILHKSSKDKVLGVFASGLMSDVLTTDQADFILVTGLTTPQVIRTCDMVQARAVLIISGKNIPQDTIELARDLNISLLRSEMPKYEACIWLSDLFPVRREN